MLCSKHSTQIFLEAFYGVKIQLCGWQIITELELLSREFICSRSGDITSWSQIESAVYIAPGMRWSLPCHPSFYHEDVAHLPGP